jgi:hypothetical protein
LAFVDVQMLYLMKWIKSALHGSSSQGWLTSVPYVALDINAPNIKCLATVSTTGFLNNLVSLLSTADYADAGLKIGRQGTV